MELRRTCFVRFSKNGSHAAGERRDAVPSTFAFIFLSLSLSFLFLSTLDQNFVHDSSSRFSSIIRKNAEYRDGNEKIAASVPKQYPRAIVRVCDTVAQRWPRYTLRKDLESLRS